jgi:hypothetical protein
VTCGELPISCGLEIWNKRPIVINPVTNVPSHDILVTLMLPDIHKIEIADAHQASVICADSEKSLGVHTYEYKHAEDKQATTNKR